MTVKITVTDAYVIAETPYDDDFIQGARKISGKFDRPGVVPARAWSFATRDEDRVRELCRQVYGTDGSSSDAPKLTVRIPVGWRTDAEFRTAGQRLVWRPGRDMPVRYADGVILFAGGFPSSGGSMRYPSLTPDPGTVIEVRDVPADVAQHIVTQVDGAEIVDSVEARREALTAERAHLVARLETVDAELAALTAEVG